MACFVFVIETKTKMKILLLKTTAKLILKSPNKVVKN